MTADDVELRIVGGRSWRVGLMPADGKLSARRTSSPVTVWLCPLATFRRVHSRPHVVLLVGPSLLDFSIFPAAHVNGKKAK